MKNVLIISVISLSVLTGLGMYVQNTISDDEGAGTMQIPAIESSSEFNSYAEFMIEQVAFIDEFGLPISSYNLGATAGVFPSSEASLLSSIVSDFSGSYDAEYQNVADCPGYVDDYTPTTTYLSNLNHNEGWAQNDPVSSESFKEHCLNYAYFEYKFTPGDDANLATCMIRVARASSCYRENL